MNWTPLLAAAGVALCGVGGWAIVRQFHPANTDPMPKAQDHIILGWCAMFAGSALLAFAMVG